MFHGMERKELSNVKRMEEEEPGMLEEWKDIPTKSLTAHLGIKDENTLIEGCGKYFGSELDIEEDDMLVETLNENEYLKEEYRKLYGEYENQKLIGLEIEAAFNKMKSMYEEKKRNVEAVDDVVQAHKATIDKVKELQEQLCEQKLLTDKKHAEVEDLNHKLHLMTAVLVQEKQKLANTRRELEVATATQQSRAPDHSMCNTLLQQLTNAKDEAFVQIKEMCKEIEELKEENESHIEANKDNTRKLKNIIAIKNELVHQNKTLICQMDGLQIILSQKDEALDRLVNRRNILAHPVVRDKIRRTNKRNGKYRKFWIRKVALQQRLIRSLVMEAGRFRINANRQLDALHSNCVSRSQHEKMEKKFLLKVAEKEVELTNVVETTKKFNVNMKQMRNVMAKLKRTIQVKNTEIAVLKQTYKCLQ